MHWLHSWSNIGFRLFGLIADCLPRLFLPTIPSAITDPPYAYIHCFLLASVQLIYSLAQDSPLHRYKCSCHLCIWCLYSKRILFSLFIELAILIYDYYTTELLITIYLKTNPFYCYCEYVLRVLYIIYYVYVFNILFNFCYLVFGNAKKVNLNICFVG